MFDYRQLPIKAGWWDAAHALQDFSLSNKYKISWLFLISCQDWVIRFLKSYMLDFILNKMAAMFINIILYSCYLKVFPRRRLLLCYLWQLKVLLKRWKMLFISSQKLFSFSKYFKFLSWLFDHVAKRLEKKDHVNFKFYDVTAWLTNNWIHIMTNIS